MNTFYGSFAAGQYSVGLRVIQIPASIIGASIYQVFLKNASEKKYHAQLYQYSISILKKLLLYTAPLLVGIAILGRPLFSFVFGNKWEVAGIYSQILAPWALLWFCASPMHSLFTITQKQNLYLVFSALNLGTRFLSLYSGKIINNNDFLGLEFFSISGFVVYGMSLIMALNLAKRSDEEQKRMNNSK
jgi:O-antigen/teichoic acid export membrane protein